MGFVRALKGKDSMMEQVKADQLSTARDEIFKRSRDEAQVVVNNVGILAVIGHDNDAGQVEGTFDEGPVVDQSSVSVPTASALESDYLATK
jgi:transcriptional regulator of NAD metabolism